MELLACVLLKAFFKTSFGVAKTFINYNYKTTGSGNRSIVM